MTDTTPVFSEVPYIRKVAAITKQLDHLKKSLAGDAVGKLDPAELSVRQEYLVQLQSTYDEAQSILEAHHDGSFELPDRFGFICVFLEVKATLTRWQAKLTDGRAMSTLQEFSIDDSKSKNQQPSSNKARLPVIELPKFSGGYLEWPNFFALFKTVVDDNDDISDLEKLHYLRSCLTGVAANTIASLELRSENYGEALNLLFNRFENKLLHFQAHLQEIISLKVVKAGSVGDLRSQSDSLKAHMRALKSIATKEQIADGLLIHTAVSKMDQGTQAKWEESLKGTALPTWSSFATFLENRCRVLENATTLHPSRPITSSHRFAHLATNKVEPVCSFCNAADHWIYRCQLFGNLSPALRYKEAKRLQLCLNCLRKGHTVQKCKSGHCRQCLVKHHTLLHMGSSSTSLSPPEGETSSPSLATESPSSKSSLNHSSLVSISENFVLLATAIILIKNRTGSVVPCRALLDSGSQLHFITSRLAQQLQLKPRKNCTQVSGIGESNFVADKAVDVVAEAQTGDYSFAFSAIITNAITDYKGNFDICTEGWRIPENIKLADTLFHKSQRIDILLGASLFFDLLCVGQIRLADHLPILQKTRLGWVVSGGGLRSRSKAVSLAAVETHVEESSNFNTFVANRVSRIQSLTNDIEWHHIPTAYNPADILSRGCTPKELVNSTLWKYGPDFLQNDFSSWPNTPDFLPEPPERRRAALIVTSHRTDLSLECKYHNTFAKMQRIFAYIYRFWILKFKEEPRRSGPLMPQDIKMGTHLLLRMIQQIHFASEHKALVAKEPISSNSKLYSLNPFIDNFGLLRVGGRLQNSALDFDARHPILLPKGHPITIALVMHFHRKFMHAGPQSLLASIRQQFWPIGGRKAICSVVNKCIQCFRLKPKLYEHIMGDLPQDRVQANRTFFTTGIDFCGPFFYKPEARNKAPIKCYICVFICFSTKAIHLEVVSDLSTASFLAALKRFICTRGRPKTIWSDNATNFVGAKNELAELKQLFSSDPHVRAVHDQCLDDGIEWHFIPPRSPHFGGLWEAAVKAAKTHFYRVVGLSVLTFDELRTLVCQVCAIINSRPLCALSENPNDLEVLTPAHFLVGAPFTSFVEPDVTHLSISHLDRWQRVSCMQQTFWQKWSTKYLTILQERSKWKSKSPNIQIGAMVLLKEENIPPLKWKLGRVVNIMCGNDGVARVAVIRTSNGTTNRAIRKTAALPMNADVESTCLSTGAGCLETH